MRRSTEALLTLVGVVAVPLVVVVFHFAGMPVQPAHAATARVVAIAARGGKLFADRDTIVIRNDHGTGQFSRRFADVHCHVGDLVPVEQRGVTLAPVAKTCR